MLMVNIGDTVYDTFGGMIEAQKITEIKHTSKGVMICSVGCFSENEFPITAIGESIFISRSEAAELVKKNHGRVREIVSDMGDDMIDD